jgi:hypothetical protein
VDLAGPTEDGLKIPSARTAAIRGHNSYFLDLVAEWEAEQQNRTFEHAK